MRGTPAVWFSLFVVSQSPKANVDAPLFQGGGLLKRGQVQKHDLNIWRSQSKSAYQLRQLLLTDREGAVQAGRFNAAASSGSLRKRLRVAAKTALATAGTMADVPASPIPPGGSEFWTMWTSMAGASSMRSTW
jgi:hypothetical protein